MPGLARSFSRTKRALGLSASFYRERAGGWPPAGASLAMDFTRPAYFAAQSSRTFDQLIDFTRTSSATYVDATGKIVSTPASRNLLTFTQEFDNAVWTKLRASITVNAAVAPDGTTTADKFVEDTSTGDHRVSQAFTPVLGSAYTYTVYAKASERSQIVFWESASGTSRSVLFDLAAGTATPLTGTGLSSTITNAGNGWYRCSISVSSVSSTSGVLAYMTLAVSGSFSYTGNGTSGIFLWGAQLEAGSTATDYTRNNGGVFPPRFDYDPVTLAPKGLLVEEQRTNLLLRSEEFDNASWTKTRTSITANATTSPDGTTNADKLVEDTSASTTHAAQSAIITFTATSYTGFVYLKAAERTWALVRVGSSGANVNAYFDLANGVVGTVGASATASITAVGNGWYKCTVSGTAAAGADYGVSVFTATGNNVATYTGDGTSGIYIWGAQLEAGSFATSYIPTVASQVTRTADVATITGANFSQFYNQSEGTFVVDADSGGNVALIPIYRVLSAGSGGDTISLFMYNSKWGGALRVGGVVQADLQVAGTYTANVPAKTSFAFKANDFAASVNGSAVLTDTSGTIPTVAALNLGSEGGSASLNGHIRSIRYYPTRLSNAQLQALTA